MAQSRAEEKAMHLAAKGVHIALNDKNWSVSCNPTNIGRLARTVWVTSLRGEGWVRGGSSSTETCCRQEKMLNRNPKGKQWAMEGNKSFCRP